MKRQSARTYASSNEFGIEFASKRVSGPPDAYGADVALLHQTQMIRQRRHRIDLGRR